MKAKSLRGVLWGYFFRGDKVLSSAEALHSLSEDLAFPALDFDMQDEPRPSSPFMPPTQVSAKTAVAYLEQCRL
jgi:hypothetical protein